MPSEGAPMGFDPATLDNVPGELRDLPQWLVHKAKVPHYADGKRRQGKQGGDADRKRLVPLKVATERAQTLGMDGIGFALLPGDGLVCVDIDNAIDAGTGEINARALAIIGALKSYTELSPSGRGFHIWGRGQTATFKSNEIGLEVYCGAQYLTVTGKWWPDSPKTLGEFDAKVIRRLRKTVDQGKGKATPATQIRHSQNAGELRAKIDSAMRFIAPDVGYKNWINVGMALHAALGAAGLPVWDAWSASGTKYPGARSLETHWRSFKPGGGVTEATLFQLAIEGGWNAGGRQRSSASVRPGSPDNAESWPELSLPGSIRTPMIGASLLPGIAGDMAAAVARSTQTPETASVMVALSILAIVFQRRFEVAPKGDGYREPLSLWTLTALPSGARKSAIIDPLAAPLHRYEKLERDRLRLDIAKNFVARKLSLDRVRHLTQEAAKTNDQEKRELLRKELEETQHAMPEEVFAPQLFTSDVTPETMQKLIARFGERMSVVSDEAGIFNIMAGQYSGGSANLDSFLQGYSGSPFRVDRAERSSYVVRPALSFGLMVQPDSLSDLAGNKRFRDSGLLARFLATIPESTVGLRDVRASTSIDETTLQSWEKLLLDSLPRGPLSLPEKVEVLQLSDEARETWFQFSETIERNQGDGGRYESIRDWTSKLPGNVARIAALMTLASTKGGGLLVDQEAMRCAVRIGELLIPHAQTMFRLLGSDPVEDDARALLRWVQANRLDRFNRAEAQKALEGRFRTVKRLKDAAARLGEWNALSPERMQKNERARPSPYYLVNPALFAQSSNSP